MSESTLRLKPTSVSWRQVTDEIVVLDHGASEFLSGSGPTVANYSDLIRRAGLRDS